MGERKRERKKTTTKRETDRMPVQPSVVEEEKKGKKEEI